MTALVQFPGIDQAVEKLKTLTSEHEERGINPPGFVASGDVLVVPYKGHLHRARTISFLKVVKSFTQLLLSKRQNLFAIKTQPLFDLNDE